eukprot:TRINITY_DN21592_c0_g1_i1.p1 TRINITY_DN21592_c0_g1~~TRINITY_DN21592_c0_g1_i1.p1  ORF type:complete len:123 (-),score=23.06 TRINITY_DN21592_c0_g1_i1:10-378(-)
MFDSPSRVDDRYRFNSIGRQLISSNSKSAAPIRQGGLYDEGSNPTLSYQNYLSNNQKQAELNRKVDNHYNHIMGESERLRYQQSQANDFNRQNKYQVYPCTCLLYTSPSPRDGLLSRMPSSA